MQNQRKTKNDGKVKKSGTIRPIPDKTRGHQTTRERTIHHMGEAGDTSSKTNTPNKTKRRRRLGRNDEHPETRVKTTSRRRIKR